jgi:hypothetical protein
MQFSKENGSWLVVMGVWGCLGFVIWSLGFEP